MTMSISLWYLSKENLITSGSSTGSTLVVVMFKITIFIIIEVQFELPLVLEYF